MNSTLPYMQQIYHVNEHWLNYVIMSMQMYFKICMIIKLVKNVSNYIRVWKGFCVIRQKFSVWFGNTELGYIRKTFSHSTWFGKWREQPTWFGNLRKIDPWFGIQTPPSRPCYIAYLMPENKNILISHISFTSFYINYYLLQHYFIFDLITLPLTN